MEESGLIWRYTVLLNREKLGLHVCCLVSVNLQRHVQGAIAQFERAIGECPEVIECFSATGEADYLLKIVAPDIRVFRQLSEPDPVCNARRCQRAHQRGIAADQIRNGATRVRV